MKTKTSAILPSGHRNTTDPTYHGFRELTLTEVTESDEEFMGVYGISNGDLTVYYERECWEDCEEPYVTDDDAFRILSYGWDYADIEEGEAILEENATFGEATSDLAGYMPGGIYFSMEDEEERNEWKTTSLFLLNAACTIAEECDTPPRFIGIAKEDTRSVKEKVNQLGDGVYLIIEHYVVE